MPSTRRLSPLSPSVPPSLFSGLNHEEGDGGTLGESGDSLLVLGIITVLGHDDEHSAVLSVFVEGLADLVESLNESVVGLGLLDHTPEGIVDGVADFLLHFLYLRFVIFVVGHN